jgi:hypothetical protein
MVILPIGAWKLDLFNASHLLSVVSVSVFCLENFIDFTETSPYLLVTAPHISLMYVSANFWSIYGNGAQVHVLGFG